MAKNPGESNAFMDFLNDPSQVVRSTGFTVGTASLKFVAMMVFAVIGTTVGGVRFDNIRDVILLSFWIPVAVLMAEQFYAQSIGYDLGKSLMSSANKPLRDANTMSETLILGEYETESGKEIIRPLNKDSQYVNIAIDRINKEDKVLLVRKRMEELIGIFDTKLAVFESLKKKRYLFPRRMKIAKKKNKLFWKKASAVAFCQAQITYGTTMLKDDKAILAVPDDNVKGYTVLSWEDLTSNQDEFKSGNESRHNMRSEKDARVKGATKKAITKLVSSMIGPTILWGALADVDFGYIAFTIFMMIIQVGMGFKEAHTNVQQIVVINASRRLQALKAIKATIPEIKKEEEDKRLESERKVKAFREELAKEYAKVLMITTKDQSKNDTYTTDILPNNLLPKFKKVLST